MTAPAPRPGPPPRGARRGGRRRSGIAAAVLAGFAATLAGPATAPAPLLANGGTLRVADAPVGGYRVSVYTDPTPPRPDSLDVSVLVVRPRDPDPVPGLRVEVRARRDAGTPGSGEPGTRAFAATREQADDPRYYAAKFAPGAEGRWTIVVAVTGPEGEGEVAFGLDVREPGPLESPWVVLFLALLPLGAVTWWLTRGVDDEDGGDGATAPPA